MSIASPKYSEKLLGFIKTLAVMAIFVLFLLQMINVNRLFFPKTIRTFDGVDEDNYKHVNITSISSLELALKQNGLWDIEANSEISPIVFNRFPVGLVTISVKNRKKIFFNSLLPVSLISQKEVADERLDILSLINYLGNTGTNLSELLFDENDAEWQQGVHPDKIKKVLKISEKYRSNDPEVLLRRVDVIPVSLILAQAAIESAWGCSRFSIAGNNIFGIWTWGDGGMVPTLRDEGLKHKVQTFDSLLGAVRAYTLMINRLPAYKKLRDIRLSSSDSYDLSEGLLNYSSRRNSYVRDVKKMIRLNNLQRFDTCRLSRNNAF